MMDRFETFSTAKYRHCPVTLGFQKLAEVMFGCFANARVQKTPSMPSSLLTKLELCGQNKESDTQCKSISYVNN